MKRPTSLGIGVTALALVVAACGRAADSADATAAATQGSAVAASATVTTAAAAGSDSAATSGATTAATAENAPVHDDDADREWDEDDEIAIDLDAMTADGGSVAIDEDTVVIRQGGTYRIHGTLDDGRVVVESGDGRIVRLVLDGAAITNTDGAAIEIGGAAEAVVVLADGSENSLSDGALDPEQTVEANAALYSTADLTITGGGSLSITGNVNDGIGAKDGLVITGATLEVTAVDDGIRGKDYLVVEDGSITVDAGGDGLKADNDTDPAMGYVSIDGATVNVTAGGDGIDAATDVIIGSGSFTITTADGSGGVLGTASAKGIKGLVSVVIDGGSFTIDSADDGVHSNDTIVIDGGEFLLSTGDDGMHADTGLELNTATITITDSYEGLESAVITINSGTIEIHADDDGINVAGGNDGSGMGGRPERGGPQDQFALDADYQLLINGGTILIYCEGDGLDSNGIATMTGGIAIVHGPTADNNGAIDAGSFDISGGILVAVGSSGMAEGVNASSSQAALHAVLRAARPAGTVVHIEASDGTPVLTFEPSKPYASVVFSSPDLEDGVTYDFLFGGEATGESTAGLYAADAYSGGTLAGSLTAG